jgi:hypothetical protein
MNLLAQASQAMAQTKGASFAPSQLVRRITTLVTLLAALQFGSAIYGAIAPPPAVVLSWDALTNADLAGYRLYIGTESGTYSAMTDAGNATQITLTDLTNGIRYFFVVTGYMTDGQEGDFSAELNFTAGNVETNPSAITMSSPTDGSLFIEPATIDFAATVNPNGHSISKVLFYNGSTLVGESISPPYSLTWSNVVAGNYALSAQVLDDTGFAASSAVANVSVSASRLPPAGPTLTLSMTPERVPVVDGVGTQDHAYEVQATGDLTTWTALGSVTADAKGHFSFTDSTAGSVVARYYRVKDLSASQVPPPAAPMLTLAMTPERLPIIQGLGRQNRTYEVQATADFRTWTGLGSVTADAAGHFSYTDSSAASVPARYYRVKDVTP